MTSLLTDDELLAIRDRHWPNWGERFYTLSYGRAVEAAILEKIVGPVAWRRMSNISNMCHGVFLTPDQELKSERMEPLYALPRSTE
jgi:hypothetical protein